MQAYPEITTVRLLSDSVTLELDPTPVAWLSDMPGFVSCMVYAFPVADTPDTLHKQWLYADDHAGPRIAILQCDDHLVLPTMTRDQAEDVVMHAYFSGGSLHRLAETFVSKGFRAMHDLAENAAAPMWI